MLYRNFLEMERDCMIAHGATEILKERLYRVSDPFSIPVCEKCGVVTNTKRDCQICKGNSIRSCNMPYASKLMFQELSAIGLKMLVRPKV